MLCPACEFDNIPGTDLCDNCGLDLAGLDVGTWGVDPEDPVLSREISSVSLKQPIVLACNDTVAAAVGAMCESGEGCVFVEDAEGLVTGVFTERDLVLRVLARGRDAGRVALSEVMTPSPVPLRSSDPFAWALHRMGVDGHRHIPIVEGRRIVGMLSVRSVLKELASIAG